MKKVFTKMSCIALGFLLFSPQMKAQQKVDFTDLLQNPSFENYLDGTSIDVTNTADPNIVGTALRGTPPGWQDSGVEPPATGNLSYGVNRGAKNKVGQNLSWISTNPMPDDFTLWQDVTVGTGEGQLPPGKYIVSCRMSVFSGYLTTQRLFAQTLDANELPTQTIVQYIGGEFDYNENLTEGETNTYAGWLLGSGTGDADARLKPLSVTITVAEGQTLRLGVKTSDWKSDGTHADNQAGFVKMDDFRLTLADVSADPNDYTYKITNPSFELNRDGELGYEHDLIYRCAGTDANTSEYWTLAPYGWSHVIPTGEDGALEFNGQSYGVNSDANNMDGARSLWAQSNPIPSYFELYQDIESLPAGKYQVNCKMFVRNSTLTTQRLFAKTASQNNVQYYAGEWDYEWNLTEDEAETYAGHSTSGTGVLELNGNYLYDLTVEIDVAAGEVLRLGVKSSNLNAGGVVVTGDIPLFRVDDFRLKKIGDASAISATAYDKVEKSAQYYSLTGIAVPATAKGLLLKKVTYTDGSVKVEKVINK